MPPELSRRFGALTGAPVLQGYGMTEASPITHLNPVHDPSLIALDSAGLPVHAYTLRAEDGSAARLPELVAMGVRGVFIDQPDLAAEPPA